MKINLLEEIRSIFDQSKTWLRLELEYAKLTIAEKLTLLMSTLIIGFVCLLLGVVVLIMLAFSLAEAFRLIMDPALAYLSTAGVICLLLILLYLLRKPLLLNPIARLITRVFFDRKH
jgi:uncharacterized protein YqhQ